MNCLNSKKKYMAKFNDKKQTIMLEYGNDDEKINNKIDILLFF